MRRNTMRTPAFAGKAVAVRPEPAARTLAGRMVVPFSIKAEGVSAEERTFEGLAAVWDLDLGGDVIHKGAFKQTLKDWKASGEALPLLNSHDHWNIMSALGQLIDAKETEDGLWTKWEVIDGPDGDAVLARLRPSQRTKRAVVGKMSIGYEPIKFDFEQSEDGPFDRIRNLRAVGLKEVSLVLFPMAPGASIDVSTVKSFLEAAVKTDPKSLNVEVKQDLRRLATRIGLLLAPQKKADGTGEDPAPPSAEPSQPAPVEDPTPTPAPVSEPAVEPPAPSPENPPTGAEGDEGGGESAGTGGEAEQKTVYLYSEALQQRLRKVLVKNKVAEVTTNSNQ